MWFVNIFCRCTQLNEPTVLFQTIQFSLSYLFALSLWVKQFYLTLSCYHSGSEKTWKWWQWWNNPHSPKLEHYKSFTIRLFSVISGALDGGFFYPSLKMLSVYFTALANRASAFWILHSLPNATKCFTNVNNFWINIPLRSPKYQDFNPHPPLNIDRLKYLE